MYVSDSRRAERNPDTIARAHDLLRKQAMALRHYEEGLTQQTSAERLGISRSAVVRLLAKLNLANAVVPRGTFERLLRQHEARRGQNTEAGSP